VISLPLVIHSMKLLNWALRLVVLALLVVFAVQNSEPVSLTLLPGVSWQLPLVVVILFCLAVGALCGALAMAAPLYRQRRALARCQRDGRAAAPSVAEPPPL